MITGSPVSARKVWVPFKCIQDVNVFLFRFTSRDVRDLHNTTIEVHDSLLPPPPPPPRVHFSHLIFLRGRTILKYKRHGNFTLLKICQMCADLQFSVKDLRRSFGPPFPKTVTVTKWTPWNTNANNSTGQGKVYMWPRLLWTGHSYTYTPWTLHHPAWETQAPSGRKLMRQPTKRSKQKSCTEVLALLHSHILYVYSSLSSKDTGLFLPGVGHFLMSNLWCMRAVWSWQMGHTEEKLSFFSFNTVGKNVF